MPKGKTTSMRFPPQLASRLEQAAKHLHKGKNAIVTEALCQYLDSIDRQKIERQLLADCKILEKDNLSDDDWEEAQDIDDWRWEED